MNLTRKVNNLSFGFLSSESAKICDEISPVFPKGIAEATILEGKQGKDRAKIVDSERIKPKTQVNRPFASEEPFLIQGRALRCAGFKPCKSAVI